MEKREPPDSRYYYTRAQARSPSLFVFLAIGAQRVIVGVTLQFGTSGGLCLSRCLALARTSRLRPLALLTARLRLRRGIRAEPESIELDGVLIDVLLPLLLVSTESRRRRFPLPPWLVVRMIRMHRVVRRRSSLHATAEHGACEGVEKGRGATQMEASAPVSLSVRLSEQNRCP